MKNKEIEKEQELDFTDIEKDDCIVNVMDMDNKTRRYMWSA